MTALKVLALTILYFACFVIISGALLAPAAPQTEPADVAATLGALFVISLLQTAAVAYIILRSSWTGWKLILAMCFAFYGVNTLMPQIETAYFVTRLPPGMLPRLFIAGAIMTAVFVPLAVLILGRARARSAGDFRRERLKLPMSEWAWKLALIAIFYIVIYFTFGYFIAWKSPAVRAYYGGSDPGSFSTQIVSVFRDTPMLFLLQAVRALLWAAIAVPIVKLMKGAWWEAGLAVGLLFAVASSQLLLPNPLMPADVRMAHLLETATSNFLFGWLVVVTLLARRS